MRFITNRLGVIYKGRIVELGDTEKIFRHPLHPYTQALISAIPQPDPLTERSRVTSKYDPAMHHYEQEEPTLAEIEPEHFVLGSREEIEAYRRQLP